MRKILAIVAAVLAVAALAVAGWGLVRIQHSDTAARQATQRLNGQLDRQLARPASPGCRISPAPGQPFARLRIPSLGVSLPVIDGTSPGLLGTGAAGRVSGTHGLPGQGNLALAAHVVSAGNPFLRLRELRPGAVVTVQSRCGTYRYQVAWNRVVHERDVWVLRPAGRPALTLITCYPATYAATPDRTVVRADLIR